MRLLNLTLPTPEANLALDEALLNAAEADNSCSGVLRLWESRQPFVAMGRASKVDQEVNHVVCKADNVPILRRCSGGTSVVAGPGCLMYGVILAYEDYPQLRVVEQAHRFVMEQMRSALITLCPDIEFRGTCDLTLGDRKFSGNALRCKRNNLLYHGTVLYDFPLRLIEKWLGSEPPRQPDYRQGRNHDSFVSNLPAEVEQIRQAICDQWKITGLLTEWPVAETESLVRDRYAKAEWHQRT